MQTENQTIPGGQVRLKPHWRHAPWWMKAGAQAVLAAVPFGEALNHRLQIWNGFRENFSWAIEANIEHFYNLIRTTSRCGLQLQGARTLEVGTGWIPTLPVGMHLLGAQIHTYDHVRHLRTADLAHLVDLYARHLRLLAEAAQCNASLLEERLRDFRRGRRDCLEAWLKPFDIHYHAPGNASQSHLPEGFLDLYFSIAVLEHVPVQAVKDMLREAFRTLRPGGLTYHVIGLFDHYTTTDPAITRVNFLKYSDFTWRIIGQNKIQFHNRLRESEFISFFEQAGFQIVDRQSAVDDRSLKALETMRLNRKFQNFDKRDLATFGTILCARKPSI